MSDHNEHACSECGSLLHYAEHCPRLNPTTPAPTEQLAPTPSEFPIALTFRQEADIKLWAADDQLWTTQETVAFNLRTLARKLVATERAAREAADTFREELRGKFHHLSDLKNEWQFRAETAEARLATVGEVLTNRYNEGRNLMNCGAETLACITQIQEYISSTTPPPILEELRRLRKQVDTMTELSVATMSIAEDERYIWDHKMCPSCPTIEAVKKLRIKHESVESQLQIAREALEYITGCEQASDEDEGKIIYAVLRAKTALAQITDGPLPSDSSASRKEK